MMLKDVPINYGLFEKARIYYTLRGYHYIEVPWMVDYHIALSTWGNSDNHYFVNVDRDCDKILVGSAEQSFLQLVQDGNLPPEHQSFMAISPCFRNEVVDETHSKQFMKLELFSTVKSVANMIADAHECFIHLGAFHKTLDAVMTDVNDKKMDKTTLNKVHTFSNYDINFKNKGTFLEIGSYGKRAIILNRNGENVHLNYTYGTGLALPRFQLALTK
jgi:phenylalanyl-tRNA synthetase alpha subunit